MPKPASLIRPPHLMLLVAAIMSLAGCRTAQFLVAPEKAALSDLHEHYDGTQERFESPAALNQSIKKKVRESFAEPRNFPEEIEWALREFSKSETYERLHAEASRREETRLAGQNRIKEDIAKAEAELREQLVKMCGATFLDQISEGGALSTKEIAELNPDQTTLFLANTEWVPVDNILLSEAPYKKAQDSLSFSFDGQHVQIDGNAYPFQTTSSSSRLEITAGESTMLFVEEYRGSVRILRFDATGMSAYWVRKQDLAHELSREPSPTEARSIARFPAGWVRRW